MWLRMANGRSMKGLEKSLLSFDVDFVCVCFGELEKSSSCARMVAVSLHSKWLEKFPLNVKINLCLCAVECA